MLVLGCETTPAFDDAAPAQGEWERQLERASEAYGEGDGARAAQMALEAADAARAEFGDDHRNVATALLAAGSYLFTQHDYDAMETAAREALVISEADLQRAFNRVANALKYVGAAQQSKGDLEGALATFEQALSLSIAQNGEQHAETAKHRGNVGAAHMALKRYAEAKRHFTEADAYWATDPEPHPVYASAVKVNLASVCVVEGDAPCAVARYKEAIDIQSKAFGPASVQVADTKRNFVSALRELGRTEEADALASELEDAP